MKLKLFPQQIFIALATGLTLAQSAIVAPMSQFNPTITIAAANPKQSKQPAAKDNSNMVFPKLGTQARQGSDIESAKEAMFRDGDYAKAKLYLEAARKSQPKEPLVYAMSTLYPFSAGELETVKEYGDKTFQAGKELMSANPMRGNLYQGVGLAIGAAYEMKKNGPLGALNKLQQVFKYMDAAKKLAPNDPELNLIKGYMDLLLAVNVPFSDTNEAIEQLQNAQPKYLAYRGIYIGYRDLKEYNKATSAIDTARKLAPNNPELIYYKAQILAIKGRESKPKNETELRESIKLFELAYQKRDRLLTSTVAQILSERCQAKTTMMKTPDNDCWGFEEQLKRDNPGVVFGPKKVPGLN
jgi:tetratricopeptide (TPR) repeat protein